MPEITPVAVLVTGERSVESELSTDIFSLPDFYSESYHWQESRVKPILS